MDNVKTVDFDMVIADCLELVEDRTVLDMVVDKDTGLKVVFHPCGNTLMAVVINTDGGVTKVEYIKNIDKEVTQCSNL